MKYTINQAIEKFGREKVLRDKPFWKPALFVHWYSLPFSILLKSSGGQEWRSAGLEDPRQDRHFMLGEEDMRKIMDVLNRGEQIYFPLGDGPVIDAYYYEET